MGRVLNISSVAAQTRGLLGPHYAASKAVQASLTHYNANVFAKEGIDAGPKRLHHRQTINGNGGWCMSGSHVRK